MMPHGLTTIALRVLILAVSGGVGLLWFPSTGWAQDDGAFFDSDGVSIHFLDEGSGEAVVLLHGFTGTYSQHWIATGVVDAVLSAGYRVIALDLRGHGLSSKLHDPERYEMEMVRDVVRLLNHLGVERVHAVGYSLGGAIVNQLVARYPERLATATLLGAGWPGDDLESVRTRLAAYGDGFEKEDASALVGAGTGRDVPLTSGQIAALNASLFARNDPDALAAVARGSLPLYEVPESDLRRTSLPVIAIVGEHDENLESAYRMQDVVPQMEVIEIPAANHLTIIGPSTEPIIAFLDEHRAD